MTAKLFKGFRLARCIITMSLASTYYIASSRKEVVNPLHLAPGSRLLGGSLQTGFILWKQVEAFVTPAAGGEDVVRRVSGEELGRTELCFVGDRSLALQRGLLGAILIRAVVRWRVLNSSTSLWRRVYRHAFERRQASRR